MAKRLLPYKELYTSGDISRYLGISGRSVRQLCDSGEIVCWRTPLGSHRRISHESICSYIKNSDKLHIYEIERPA